MLDYCPKAERLKRVRPKPTFCFGVNFLRVLLLKILQRPQRIAEDLRNNLITEREKFYFFLVGVILDGFYGVRSFISYFSIYTFIEYVLILGGIWWCFQANSNGDNRQFLDRFICLQTAIVIRVYAVIYGLYFLLGAIWSMLSNILYFPQIGVVSFLFWNGLFLGGNCYIYITTRKLIKYVATSTPV
jgi:hypothetical protein